MRYIENEELREWVKESLRKTIFQKAHALAVQTGCEILVKLKDAAGVYNNPLYYASDTLQESYRKDGVREEPGEMFVSGVTGLPIFPMVDSGTQSISDSDETIGSDLSRVVEAVDQGSTSQDISGDDSESAVPMQLSMVSETRDNGMKPKQESQTGVSTIAPDSLSNVVVKLERLDDEVTNSLGVPDEGGGGDDMLGQGTGAHGSYEEIDNSFSGGDQVTELNTSIGAQPYPIMSPKPYQCGVCGKAFRTVQVLQKHTQTFHMRPQMGGSRNRGRGRGLYHGRPGAYRQLHTSQARFLCVMCNRSFRSPDLLQDHMTRSHMSQATPIQLSQPQETFDPSSVQTSQAPATATLQSLQQQQQQEQQLAAGITFQNPDDPTAPMQSDQSAFNVSSASTSGTFIPPSIPSSMFQGISAGASTSAVAVQQSTPSRMRRRRPSLNQPVPIVKVMTSILRTTGPVLTHIAVRRNGAPVFRRVSIDQFKQAAQKLQAANLGNIVELRLGGGKPSVVFIKKPPADVHDILEQNPGFITSNDYAQRYNSPMLSSIPPKMAGELLAKGLVPREFF